MLGLVYRVMLCVVSVIYRYVLCWSGIYSYVVCGVWYIELCFVLGLVYTVMLCVGSDIYRVMLCVGYGI